MSNKCADDPALEHLECVAEALLYAARQIEVDAILSRPYRSPMDRSIIPYDMAYARSVDTLEASDEDWHPCKYFGISVVEKRITIVVCEVWPQVYWRVPVLMVVPANGGATNGVVLNWAVKPKYGAVEGNLNEFMLRQGVGFVLTQFKPVVSQCKNLELKNTLMALLMRTGDFRYNASWIWGLQLMRALTAVMDEPAQYFSDNAKAKVLSMGGSKGGLAAQTALIYDDRLKAALSSAAAPNVDLIRWTSQEAKAKWSAANKLFFSRFPAPDPDIVNKGMFSRATIHQQVLSMYGWNKIQIRRYIRDLMKLCLIGVNRDRVDRRDAVYAFVLGSHDALSPDLALCTEMRPKIPILILPNTGHDVASFPDSQDDKWKNHNIDAFMRDVFFGSTYMMEPPTIRYLVQGNELTVEVEQARGPHADTSTLYWYFDRAPRGSVPYKEDLFNFQKEMAHVGNGVWRAEVQLKPCAQKIDFFSVLSYRSRKVRSHTSSAYKVVALCQK